MCSRNRAKGVTGKPFVKETTSVTQSIPSTFSGRLFRKELCRMLTFKGPGLFDICGMTSQGKAMDPEAREGRAVLLERLKDRASDHRG